MWTSWHLCPRRCHDISSKYHFGAMAAARRERARSGRNKLDFICEQLNALTMKMAIVEDMSLRIASLEATVYDIHWARWAIS